MCGSALYGKLIICLMLAGCTNMQGLRAIEAGDLPSYTFMNPLCTIICTVTVGSNKSDVKSSGSTGSVTHTASPSPTITTFSGGN